MVREVKESNDWICDVCRLDFSVKYGVKYIEAHHKDPLKNAMSSKKTSLKDLVLLCPNCHRAVHAYMIVKASSEYKDIKEYLINLLLAPASR